jgi:hypothetical protein
MLSRAPGTDERVVQGDGIHSSCPNQQRVCCVRCALIAVAATLHDEIDGGNDVVRRPGDHRVRAWPRRPGVDPSEGLGKPDLVAEEVGVLQFFEDMRALGA